MTIDYTKSPAQAMTMVTAHEVERLKAYIGFNQLPLDRRPRLLANEPGVLVLDDGHGYMPKELSLVGALRLLSSVPRFAGPDVARKLLAAAAAKGDLRAYPRNSLTHVMPGDTIGEGTVHSVIDGRRFPDPRNGDPVPSVSRRMLASASDKFVVTFDSPEGGFWRKGHMLPRVESKLAHHRRDLPRLREVFRGLKAEIRDEVRGVRNGQGSPERLMNLSRMGTALHRLLDTEGRQPTFDRKAEAAFMRLRQRDLKDLGGALDRLGYDGSYPMGKAVDEAIAMVASERRGLAIMIKAVNKAIRAERPEPEAAPAP